MRKIILFLLLGAMTLTMGLPAAAVAAEEAAPPFTVAKLVVCKDVVNREPVPGKEEKFPASVGRISCFLEARDIRADSQVLFVWLHGTRELASVPVTLQKGPRWRTFSTKKLGGRTGDWRVEIRDPAGAVIDSVPFTVE